jgi:septal ring factor EnvC (AmiA/AmiB activator)
MLATVICHICNSAIQVTYRNVTLPFVCAACERDAAYALGVLEATKGIRREFVEEGLAAEIDAAREEADADVERNALDGANAMLTDQQQQLEDAEADLESANAMIADLQQQLEETYAELNAQRALVRELDQEANDLAVRVEYATGLLLTLYHRDKF